MNISENMLLAGLIVGVTLIFLTLIVAGFAQVNRARKFTHAERIKALEMGQPLPDDPETARIKAAMARTSAAKLAEFDASKSLAYQCYTTTGWVSGCGFLFAAGVGSSAGSPVAYAIAAAAGAVGVTGMICGTVLATKEVRSESSMAISKPRFDPEAL